MCGIAGFYAFDRRAAVPSLIELQRISEWQRERGPDDHGVWQSADLRCALDHRRLAIIDPSPAGHQPMVAEERGLCITFNGEIYNYRELRAGLEQAGVTFRTGSDTEVLLHLYAAHGADMLARLRGMYAFAIWDESRRGLFVARDPLGIKPFYYAVAGGTFRFASLARGLLAGGSVSSTTSAAARAGFLIWGSVPEPLTWWRDISPLPAGHWMWIDERGCGMPQRFFDLAAAFERRLAPGEETSLPVALAQSVAEHMVADVPVGVFLSSGIDSVAIASLACAGARERLQSVTVSFDRFAATARDESPVAAAVAAKLRMAHQTVTFGLADFVEHRPSILAAMDQPTIDGINTYFVSLAARRTGLKVALSGVGGDELLGGYPSFRQVPALVRNSRMLSAVPNLGQWLRRGLAPLLPRTVSPKYASLAEFGGSLQSAYLLRRSLYLPWELDQVLGRDAAEHARRELRDAVAPYQLPRGSAYGAVAFLEMSAYMRNQLLRDTDWSSMRHGVEVRVPFADATLIGQLAPQVASARPPTKADLAACIDPEVRSQIERLPKRGFEVPIGEWLAASGSSHAHLRGWRGWARDVMAAFD